MSVYVFNALEDTTLYFDGRPFTFPLNQVVELEDQVFRAPDLYKRHHPSDQDPSAMLESKMSAMDFAKMLLNRQYVNLLDAGFYVGDKTPLEVDRRECKKKATAYKRRQIDLALQERRERQAGGHGRLEFDPKIIAWMQELGIEDNLYNPDAGDARIAKTLAHELAEAMQRLAESKSAAEVKTAPAVK